MTVKMGKTEYDYGQIEDALDILNATAKGKQGYFVLFCMYIFSNIVLTIITIM
jgi:hypothetical protein